LTYQLDLQTMLEQLAGRSGILEADLKPGIYLRTPRLVRIILIAGKIKECTITPKNGKGSSIFNEEALAILQQIAELQWTYTPQAIQPAPSSPPAPAVPPIAHIPSYHGIQPTTIPRQTRAVALPELRTWPRLHRLAFSLVDGHKSCNDIARLLNQPLAALLPIFHDLQSAGIIMLHES